MIIKVAYFIPSQFTYIRKYYYLGDGPRLLLLKNSVQESKYLATEPYNGPIIC